jgi:spoIIIJ-associated protein
MELKEFAGETVEEATAKAEAYFGLSRDELTIKVVADETTGLLGFGMNKRAVIVARPKGEALSRARVHAPAESAPAARSARESRGPGGRGRERGRERGHERPRDRRENRHTGRSHEPARRREAPSAPSVPRGQQTDRSAHVRGFLAEILARMPLEQEVEVAHWETEEAIELEMQTDSHGLLTGPGGEVLEAITYLVNRMANKGATNAKRVVIQAEGFRSDRVASLERLALEMASRVRASGMPVTLDPMNSYDRRIVHLTLQEEPGVCTESVGTGALKSLVIRPTD